MLLLSRAWWSCLIYRRYSCACKLTGRHLAKKANQPAAFTIPLLWMTDLEQRSPSLNREGTRPVCAREARLRILARVCTCAFVKSPNLQLPNRCLPHVARQRREGSTLNSGTHVWDRRKRLHARRVVRRVLLPFRSPYRTHQCRDGVLLPRARKAAPLPSWSRDRPWGQVGCRTRGQRDPSRPDWRYRMHADRWRWRLRETSGVWIASVYVLQVYYIYFFKFIYLFLILLSNLKS